LWKYANVPILASAITAHQEVLHFPDLLFDKDDASMFANKVQSLINSPSNIEKNRELVKIRREKFAFNWNDKIVSICTAVTK